MSDIKWPNCRFPTIEELKTRATKLYTTTNLQERWVNAIIHLRDSRKGGWVGDERDKPIPLLVSNTYKSIKK